MRDRFGLIQRLDFFEEEDMIEILRRASRLWSIEMEEGALKAISAGSRGTARVGLRLLRRVRDYAQNSNLPVITKDSVYKTMELLGIDDLGLENIDREILRVMYFNFEGGPVGLSTLGASVSEDISTITDVHEPFLMKCGLIKRTSRGRVLTSKGIKYVESIWH